MFILCLLSATMEDAFCKDSKKKAAVSLARLLVGISRNRPAAASSGNCSHKDTEEVHEECNSPGKPSVSVPAEDEGPW